MAAAAALAWWYVQARSQRALRSFRYFSPGSTIAIHLDLAALRNSPLVRRTFKSQGLPPLEPEYAEFVHATGFDFERDLDSVSLGISGAEGARVVHAILQGRFDRQKADHYSRQHRQDTHVHLGHTISLFTGPSGRQFRLAFLTPARLAFSNAPEAWPIEKMIELAEGRGPDLEDRLEELRVPEHLPAGTQLWVAVDLERAGYWKVPAGVATSGTSFSTELLRGSRMGLLAVRTEGQQVDFRMVAECSSGEAAQRVAGSLSGLRALLVALAEREEGDGQGAEMARALRRISIVAEKNATVVRWRLEAAWLEQLLRQPSPPQPASNALPTGKGSSDASSWKMPAGTAATAPKAQKRLEPR